MNATIDEFRIDIDLRLHEPGSGPTAVSYVISPDEHVIARFGGNEVELIFSDFQAPGGYFGAIPVDETSVNDDLRITFDRGSLGTTTITGSTPPPFTITAPSTQSAAESVTVTWTPPATDEMGWFGSGCAGSGRIDGPIPEDLGTLTFPPGVLAASTNQVDCAVFLTFVRTRSLQPQLEFRSPTPTTVSVTREVRFTLTP